MFKTKIYQASKYQHLEFMEGTDIWKVHLDDLLIFHLVGILELSVEFLG